MICIACYPAPGRRSAMSSSAVSSPVHGSDRVSGVIPRAVRGLATTLLVTLMVTLVGTLSCAPSRKAREPAEEPRPTAPPVERPDPALGVVLLSIDTLRADHLGAYGYDRDTSPHLDALARRAVVFEAAFSHSPSTLISHMSLFTSLFPPEHGVRPPQHNVLADAIPTLPEAFRAAGFRTAGHTEGGYMEGDHGFARGFEEWTDPGFSGSTDIESTFEKGLDFLRRAVAEDPAPEPFFLFLHTYSVHDPYEPPPEYRHRYWQGAPPTELPASAETLESANAGRLEVGTEEAEYYASRYDDGIRYADEVVGRFVAQLESLGLLDRITLMVTSDHGEEFLDHGRMLHTQVVPELLHVPLLVLHPGLTPRRVERPVRLVDLAPTLLDLAGLDAAALSAARGVSLMPELTGQARSPAEDGGDGGLVASYAEVAFLDAQRSWFTERDGELWQIVEKKPLADPDGAWIAREVEFDVEGRRAGLRLASFHRPRNLRIERVEPNGETDLLVEQVLPPEWTELEVRLGGDSKLGDGERSRLRLSVDGCDVPEQLGMGGDPRCLGFMIAAPEPSTRQLFSVHPAGGRLEVSRDLSGERTGIFRRLEQVLESTVLQSVAAPASRELSEEERKALEALGYL